MPHHYYTGSCPLVQSPASTGTAHWIFSICQMQVDFDSNLFFLKTFIGNVLSSLKLDSTYATV